MGTSANMEVELAKGILRVSKGAQISYGGIIF